ncbi:ATP-grasp domain-containing protein [Nocardia sp. MDA0666]|uniref:ATP-grasp domain-containing protein n=1 Tax=Nocardia sp. MDA0666 TaxID=2135448 RepID=UPI001304E808|nr:ATP-grasp domain-containing protein [Nocardia sp. MDA0666]
MIVLVPADVLRPGRADAHFAADAEAARASGMQVDLVDHDALIRDDAAAAVRRVRGEGPAICRGWMMRSQQYAAFDDALRARGITLRTDARHYRRAHEFPGWYDVFARHTPESSWTRGVGRDEFDRARSHLGSGPAVVRDYTKSMKHHWHEAMYIPDLADTEAAWRVAQRLCELRGPDLTGGFVLRRYEALAAEEVRTWWVDGSCRLAGPHPDTPDRMPRSATGRSAIDRAPSHHTGYSPRSRISVTRPGRAKTELGDALHVRRGRFGPQPQQCGQRRDSAATTLPGNASQSR